MGIKNRILSDNFAYSAFCSLVTGNFGQKYRYKNVRIPFGLKQYLELLNSAYFTTDTGELGKMEDLQWTMGKQYAIATFIVYRKYVTSLKETIIQG